jgi:hypothetical protein
MSSPIAVSPLASRQQAAFGKLEQAPALQIICAKAAPGFNPKVEHLTSSAL